MLSALRVLTPEELGLVAGGSMEPPPEWDPNIYSSFGFSNVPVFSATSWTTSSFGINYYTYAAAASLAGFSSTNDYFQYNAHYSGSNPYGDGGVVVSSGSTPPPTSVNLANQASQNPDGDIIVVSATANTSQVQLISFNGVWLTFDDLFLSSSFDYEAYCAVIIDTDGELQNVSEDGLEFIFDTEMQEGVSNDIHHPSANSGVTIGAGYDMKGRSAAEVRADLIAVGVSPTVAAQLAAGAGLSGTAAANFVNQNDGLVNLSHQQQVQLGMIAIAPFVEAVRSAFILWELNQNQFDALVSFSYNLGQNVFTASGNTTLRAAIDSENGSTLTSAMANFVYSGGVLMQGLVDRRAAEIALFNTPED